MQVIVYSGSGDLIELTLYNEEDETPIPFVTNGITKMTLFFDGKSVSSDGNEISFDDDGNITLKLGEVVATKYRNIETELKAFSPAFPEPLGQSLINPSRPNANLSLVFR